MKKQSPVRPRSAATVSGQSLSPAALRQVTMADVAAKVGVSKMTVSRALNRSEGSGRSSATLALHERILQACKEMGYVVDQTARTFSSKRSGFVAALIYRSLKNGLAGTLPHGTLRHTRPFSALLYTDFRHPLAHARGYTSIAGEALR